MRYRFTPACAGQTLSIYRQMGISPVHPRVCGADRTDCCAVDFGFGSPPRVRGRLFDTPYLRDYSRFTPACAGQTSPMKMAGMRAPVHPRVCGADPAKLQRNQVIDGSPPRVRGRPDRFFQPPPGGRFTPACAGQTRKPARNHTERTVHPRVCGADLLGAGFGPVVRRFTPACAGQTFSPFANGRARRVHPRVCGADGIGAASRKVGTGSPPRVRGRRSSWKPGEPYCRFTPACAGQTVDF